MGRFGTLILVLTGAIALADSDDSSIFKPADVFQLEYALDPQISPDGRRVAYLRQSMDVMTDQAVSNVWIVDVDGSGHRPLVSGTDNVTSPRWSPSGDRLAYVASAGPRGAELFVRWMDSGQTALLTNLPNAPGSVSWSPDGELIALQMFVESRGLELAAPPPKPDGAVWADPVRVISDLPYRVDGAGYLRSGHTHLFVIPASGGTPRQLTAGDFDHTGPMSWSPDGTSILYSANRISDPNTDPQESEIWRINVRTGEQTQLTDRDGPDYAPAYSPNGRRIAYLGFDDRNLSSHQVELYVAGSDGGDAVSLTADLDRSVQDFGWRGSDELIISYDDHGKRKLARLSLRGALRDIVDDVGSASTGRPYTNGSFSVAPNGNIAYTRGSPVRPSEVGVVRAGGSARSVTALNDDLFAIRKAADVEEIVWKSSVGDYDIQGWIVKPPGFDAERVYPLILEIHGGPFTAYGPHFSPEIQLYAAAGYVVLYSNPRGSTSYGQKFVDEIHHNYPSRDYDDLMSGVDAMLERGYIDETQLFVTGGSGGGVLTSWIVGKTDRFRAAVVQKPVINWGSFALTADFSAFFTRYWFSALPWEDPEQYWRRSPLSLVGNVTTPTMLITGEQDFRTPMGESEQYYQALKLRGIDTALVRVPERSHNLVGRPSHLIAKAANILGWFERYRMRTTSGS
ncbi:MAG: S9 family peptidase [Woeseiaceae bacterium]|nr:S9 family peptidase [Woeseiaceae bacterium]